VLISSAVFSARGVASAATTREWVRVSVATVWDRPSSARPIDAPAIEDPAQIEEWLDSLSVPERLGLDSRINTQVLLGELVIVTGHRGIWTRVEVPDQTGSKYPNGIVGWVPRVQLTAVPPPTTPREVIVGVPLTWLYAVNNGMIGRRLFLVSFDTELPVVGSLPSYALVGLPGGESGAIRNAALGPPRDGPVSGSAIVRTAREFLGLPYLWGGTSGFGFDCSGLVYAVYARYGVYLPRDAADQQHAGTPVSVNDLQPGDLLFFAGRGGKGPADHVAIYVGDGRVIDSPYTGASVELVPMASLPVWSDFSGAIHVTGDA
jgi:gamma-D-glutamyl-L-lysine dipeptidyl-peptidase